MVAGVEESPIRLAARFTITILLYGVGMVAFVHLLVRFGPNIERPCKCEVTCEALP